MNSDLFTVQQVDPAELSPGQFAHTVRNAVDVQGARVVIIDSLNGYLNAMPDERFLTIQMHELLTYLKSKGRGDDSGDGATRIPRYLDGDSSGRQLFGRHCNDVAILRNRWRCASGNFGDQEAQWRARAHDSPI